MALSTQQRRAIDRIYRQLRDKSQKASSRLHAMEATKVTPPDEIVDYCNTLDEVASRLQAITLTGGDPQRQETLWKEWEERALKALDAPWPGEGKPETSPSEAQRSAASTEAQEPASTVQ